MIFLQKQNHKVTRRFAGEYRMVYFPRSNSPHADTSYTTDVHQYIEMLILETSSRHSGAFLNELITEIRNHHSLFPLLMPLPATLDIPDDPSDFEISSLRSLDASLRCHICRDFYIAPVILPCSHTFCSTCVRSALDEDTRRSCPSCGRSGIGEILLPNFVLEEVVDQYRLAR